MNHQLFDSDAYLQRIGYSGAVTPSEDTLMALHHAQLYTIPFENFDIQLGREIRLEPEAVFKKLVVQNRGGYCFELNGLFLAALKSMGFDARPLLARVHVTGAPTGRTHQLELITLNGRSWIADAGFGGDTPRAPIPLELNQPSTHDGQTIRVVDADEFGMMLQAEKDDGWADLYSFDLTPVVQADIDMGNYYTSHHPGALFVFARVAALPVKNGVITLFNTTLKKKTGGNEVVHELSGGRAYIKALEHYFGIELDAPYETLRPLEHPGTPIQKDSG